MVGLGSDWDAGGHRSRQSSHRNSQGRYSLAPLGLRDLQGREGLRVREQQAQALFIRGSDGRSLRLPP